MDGEISARLMRLAGKHPLLDRFWVFCARYLIVLLGASLLWAYWLLRQSDVRSGGIFLLLAVASIIVNETVSWGIGYIRFRPRPFVENHLTPLVRIAPGMKSFPSDHAVISFTVATALFFAVGPVVGAVGFATALLISAARVVSGVHYPSDVLAGATLGVLGTVAVFVGVPVILPAARAIRP